MQKDAFKIVSRLNTANFVSSKDRFFESERKKISLKKKNPFLPAFESDFCKMHRWLP